jgi:hypothetical protein
MFYVKLFYEISGLALQRTTYHIEPFYISIRFLVVFIIFCPLKIPYNMKSILRTTIIALLFFFSFHSTNAQKITTAIQFNDYLVSITDTLYLYGQEWGGQFNTAYSSKDFKSLTPIRTKIQQFASRKFLEVTTMKDMYGSEKLRTVMLEFLAYEKLMIGEHFSAIENLNSSSSNEDIQKGLDALTIDGKSETAALKKVNEAQKEYAKKNGFTIEEDQGDAGNQ